MLQRGVDGMNPKSAHFSPSLRGGEVRLSKIIFLQIYGALSYQMF